MIKHKNHHLKSKKYYLEQFAQSVWYQSQAAPYSVRIEHQESHQFERGAITSMAENVKNTIS